MLSKKKNDTDKKVKEKVGRKSKYETYVKIRFDEILGWIKLGIIEAEICSRLGIAVSSWEKYKTEFLELTELLKKGHAKINNDVVNALYKTCIGYIVDETEVINLVPLDKYGEPKKDNAGNIIKPKVAKIRKLTKHILPNTTALIFWLKNKLPGEFKDKHEHEIDLNIKVTKARQPTPEEIEECLSRNKIDE